MDCKLSRGLLPTQELVFDGCEEKPVDLDFSLPDYCPDIQRILKCQVYPVITVRSVIGDRLEVEGRATVRVLYLDAGGTSVRHCEKTEPFSASIALRKTPESPIALVRTRMEYINCRAVSPRRLDIHGAFSVCARVFDAVKYEYYCGVEGEALEEKTETLRASRLAAYAQQPFVVGEVLEIGNGKPPAEAVLRVQADALLQDYKIVSGKIILKGEVQLKLLYAAGIDTVSLESMEYAIPFSETIDCEGITEDALCDIRLAVSETDIQIRSDSSGENMLLEAEARVIATVSAFEQAEITVVTDAYSTQYETALSYRPVSLRLVADVMRESAIQKITLNLGDTELVKITDIWNEIVNVQSEVENGKLLCRGKMNLCILAVNTAGKPVYFERMAEILYTKERAGLPETAICDTDVAVTNIGYRISGTSELEIKAELQLEIQIAVNVSGRELESVYEDEGRPRNDGQKAALTIYYAMTGESLWDIARTYCTSVAAIQAENGMTSAIAESGGMLLIPS